jgi:putative Mg2+ transporter-C (MgtC) family protein
MHPGQALWPETGELLLALVLSSAIGLERESRRKSAGLRTQALVGVGAALFMVVSKYGFFDVLQPGRVVVDPSRVAAQIVTGVGFLGAGVIFVHRGSVKGLTTAAAIWLSAAVGASCGAGLVVLATVVTAGYFLVTHGYPRILRALPPFGSHRAHLQVVYVDGQGVLRRALARCGELDFEIERLSLQEGEGVAGGSRGPLPARSRTAPSERHALGAAASWWATGSPDGGSQEPAPGNVKVLLDVEGPRPLPELVRALSEIDGVIGVELGAAERL